MPLVLVRRPRPGKVQHREITDTVRDAYGKYANEILIKRLESDVEDWEEEHKPKFKAEVAVSYAAWRVTVSYDKRTKGGKIYTWVNEGTAERGGKGSAYRIYPKSPKQALAFDAPYLPKTLPNVVGNIPGIVMSQPKGVQIGHVVVKSVLHKGITPRNFTGSLVTEQKDRNKPGAFRSVTDAAVKRGVRKIGSRR